MRLRLRLLLLLLSSFWKKPLGVLDESVITLTVLPNDVDVRKVTRDRYFAMMDLGRMDLVFRSELLKLMLKNKWVPVSTYDTIRFRYPLKVFQRFQLKTQVVWWDDAAVYVKHTFERKGRVVATSYGFATFLGSNGPVPPQKILDQIGIAVIKPSQPQIVARLKESEFLVHETQKDTIRL